MKGDRTNYGKDAEMKVLCLRLHKKEIAYIESCAVSPKWTLQDTIKQIIKEHREWRD